MLDKLVKLTTLLGTVLIFNGVLYLTIYYQSFGIKIFSYLQFSEIITAFLDNINLILIFFLIYLLNSGLAILGLTKTIDFINKDPISESDKRKNIKLIFGSFKIGLIIKAIIILIVASLIMVGYLTFKIWMIYFLCILFFDIIDLIFEKINNILITFLSKVHYQLLQNILIFVIPFTLFTIIIAQFNATKVKQNAQEITMIQKDNHKIHTGKYNKFIGKTNNYIFLYDSDSQNSMSVSLADVKSIEYH